jgi:spore maturation protein CgeB
MQRFFSDKETVWFDGAEDLAEKILHYHAHDAERAAIASAGRARYHQLFNGARVLKFMVDTMLGETYSEQYEWAEEVYR